MSPTSVRMKMASSQIKTVELTDGSLDEGDGGSRRYAARQCGDDGRRNVLDVGDFARRAKRDRRGRHAEDHAGAFALRDGVCPTLLELEQAARSVLADASQENADRLAAHGANGGTKQHVHARPVTGNDRTVEDADSWSGRAGKKLHVAAA